MRPIKNPESFQSPLAKWATRGAVAVALLSGCGESAGAASNLPDSGTTDVQDSAPPDNSALSEVLCVFDVESIYNLGGSAIRRDIINVGTTTTSFSLWPNSNCQEWIERNLRDYGQIPDGGDRPSFVVPATIVIDPNNRVQTSIDTLFTVTGGERYKPAFHITAVDLVNLAVIPAGFTGVKRAEIRFPTTQIRPVRTLLQYDLTAPVITDFSLQSQPAGLVSSFRSNEAVVWSLAVTDSNSDNPFAIPGNPSCTLIDSPFFNSSFCSNGTACTVTSGGGICELEPSLRGQTNSGGVHNFTTILPNRLFGTITGKLRATDLGGNFVETAPITVTR